MRALSWIAMAGNQIDQLLRRPSAPRKNGLILLFFAMLYGAVMGAYGGFSGTRGSQILYSALKVPVLLLVTFFLSLPSFFVINTLFGLRGDFPQALRALGATQAVLTVVLASLAPFTALWYLSTRDYGDAILFNAAMFALASFSAQIVLRRQYRALVARRPRHRWMLRLWLMIYCFVGIQMGWILRPYIGDPNLPTYFLRPGALSNAYVTVVHMIWEKLR